MPWLALSGPFWHSLHGRVSRRWNLVLLVFRSLKFRLSPYEFRGTACVPKGQARELWSSRAPGVGSQVGSDDPIQRMRRSRANTQVISRVSRAITQGHLNSGYMTGVLCFICHGTSGCRLVQRLGASTGDGQLPPVWLKIDSPKAREDPRVIIFRPWLEKRRSSHGSCYGSATLRTKHNRFFMPPLVHRSVASFASRRAL